MLTFGSPAWLIPATVLAVTGTALVWWSARRARGTAGSRRIASLFKLAALGLLAACLVDPLWSGVQPKPHSNLFLVVADNSRSQTIGPETSTPGPPSRQIQTALADRPDSWLKHLEQDFELHRFAFDRRLRHVDGFEELTFNGESSSLGATLTSLNRRFRDRPVAGIVLLADGQATDMTVSSLDALLRDTDGLPPVYPVDLASPSTQPDLAIESVSVSQTPFEDAPVSVQCDVSVNGFDSAALEGTDALAECRLIDAQGRRVRTERLGLDAGTTRLPFRFTFRPVATGLAFYRLEIAAVNVASEPNPALPEATLDNNTRLIQVDRGTRRQRVLYVSGRPNWEFKFLRRSIDDDELIDLVGMIRVARREAKFDFRGREGQSSNSLFRGFRKDTDEDTERYDEPVLVRLNTRDGNELRRGFPAEAEELFQFDALILDDVEAAFFTQDQMTLIDRFVSERGGGLLMLGGAESFETGDYDRTPIADALPVYLDRAAFPAEDAELSLLLTREGWLQPWARLRSTESDEQRRLASMPGFQTVNPTRGIKPGASVLATVRDAQNEIWPALVTQPYGRGRSAALLIGDLWRWQLQRTEDSPEDMAKAWRQTIRWLVADVPQRVDIRTSPAPDTAPEAVRVEVQVVDPQFRPLDNTRVRIRIAPQPLTTSTAVDSSSATPADPQPRSASSPQPAPPAARAPEELILDATPSLDRAGVYTAVFVPRSPGAWTLTAEALTDDGTTLEPATAGWMYQPSVDEFRHHGVNRDLLRQLAEQTGGELLAADRLDQFVSGLNSKELPVMEAWTMPLWDRPLVFLVVLGCLLGEWGLRRVKGLP